MKETQQIYPEAFYNFQLLCDAVLHRDLIQARLVLEEQSQCLFESERPSWESMMVFLTSMNRSLYNFILYRTSLSLHQCCFENSKLMHKCHTRQQFFDLAEQILEAYCSELRCDSCRGNYITRAKAYIDWNLDKPLRLEEVAARVFISKTYLSELFTSYTGMSFTTYVTRQRMQRAKKLLLSTRMSIHDVGQACGFYSSAYFSTVFTRQFGLSPSRYRTAMAQLPTDDRRDYA